MDTITAVQAFLGGWWQSVFLAITHLGSESAYILLLSLYYWLMNPRVGRRLGGVISLSYCSTLVLKGWFDVPRPYVLNPEVATLAAQATGGGASFPSGHAQGAATFWGSLALYHRRVGVWVVAIATTSLVAFSRVYLGVHYPVDAIAGLLLGGGFAWLGYRLPALPAGYSHRSRRWAVLLGGFAVTLVWTDLAKPLGVLAGFWLAPASFTPPRTWGHRIAMAGVGLAASFGVLLVLKQFSLWLAAPAWADYWRYWLLTAFITAGWPWLFKRAAEAANKFRRNADGF